MRVSLSFSYQSTPADVEEEEDAARLSTLRSNPINSLLTIRFDVIEDPIPSIYGKKYMPTKAEQEPGENRKYDSNCCCSFRGDAGGEQKHRTSITNQYIAVVVVVVVVVDCCIQGTRSILFASSFFFNKYILNFLFKSFLISCTELYCTTTLMERTRLRHSARNETRHPRFLPHLFIQLKPINSNR